jgi:hypothetical protein
MVEKNYKGFSEESLRRIALKKVNFRMSVKIHFGVFIVVSLLLVFVNYLFTPLLWWAFIPILGWFIGFSEHLTSYLVYARGVYPMSKRGVIFHIVAYVTTSILLFAINLMTNPFYWVIFPLIFWGAALMIHIVSYSVLHRGSMDKSGVLRSKKERAIEKEMHKMKNRMSKDQ